MKQWHSGQTIYQAGSPTTLYINIQTPWNWAASDADAATVMSAPGTLRNLTVRVNTAPGAGTSFIYTLFKNNTATALVATIADTATTGSDTSNAVTFAIGDTMSLRRTETGSPTSSTTQLTAEWDGDNVAQSVHGYGSRFALSASATRYNGVFKGQDTPATATQTQIDVVACAGTLTRHDVKLSVAPGTAKDYTFTIYKNGVKQDGTGGTVNTQIQVAGTATTGNATFSLSLSAGDTTYLEIVPTGTPTAAKYSYGSAFTSAVDGLCNYCGANNNDFRSDITEYDNAQGNVNWTSTEADTAQIGGINTFKLSGMRVLLSAAPSTGDSYTISVRRNTGSPSGAPSVTISDTATTGFDATGVIVIQSGDIWNLRNVPVSLPDLVFGSWGFIMGIAAYPDFGEGNFPFIGSMQGGGVFVG